MASCSAAWGDAAVICPWQIYQTYGDIAVLEEQFSSMKAWVDYIGKSTTTPDLWTGHFHFGDWLGLDAPAGSCKGSSREDFVATAFYAHSTELLIKTGKLLGADMSEYEEQYARTVSAFRNAFPDYLTQTEHVLAVKFGLTEHPQETADKLANMIKAAGNELRTGFVGTPYLLHSVHINTFRTLFFAPIPVKTPVGYGNYWEIIQEARRSFANNEKELLS